MKHDYDLVDQVMRLLRLRDKNCCDFEIMRTDKRWASFFTGDLRRGHCKGEISEESFPLSPKGMKITCTFTIMSFSDLALGVYS
jgi:hypothetical protein